jgi:hypothetical protein
MTIDEGRMESRSEPATDPEVDELKRGIEQTRAGMSATVAALETRLNPKDLREKVGTELQQVEDRVRAVVRDQLAEAKAIVQGELVEAKGLLRAEMNEAEEKVRKGLAEAKQAITSDVKQAVSDAKASARAATIGKVEDLATSLGDKMNDTRDTLIDTIRNNPVPAAVAGVGLVWLLMNRSKAASRRRFDGPDSGGYDGSHRSDVGRTAYGARDMASRVAGEVGDTVVHARDALGHAAHQATDAAGQALHQASNTASSALHGASDMASGVAHQAAETASALVHGVGDTASHLAHQASDVAGTVATGARRSAHRAEEGFQRTLHDNPMAIGAAAIAMGAIVGFSLPRTKAEDSLMGAARDQVVRQAGEAAETAAGAITRVTEQTADRAKKTLEGSLGSGSK